MATNIPPHNLGEVIDATIHLIDHPDATPDDLMKFVKGPDFPTGALIIGRSGHRWTRTRPGRGSIKVRAVAEIEEGKNGDRIVVTEIPYQTSVEGIERKIADLVNNREIDGIARPAQRVGEGQDELVIELKQGREPARRAEQALQAHAAADELRRQHAGARRRRAAHAEPRATR